MEDPQRVKDFIKDQFSRHFSRCEGIRVSLDGNGEVQRLGGEERDDLLRRFSEEGVREAIWECDGAKSPRPDGFNFAFYKAWWAIIKADLLRVMDEFYDHDKLVKGGNASFIILIPKKDGACDINHFRPISLIGSLYKTVSKVLAKRMKLVMGLVIGEAQSTFIQGRNILDGVVILNETVEDAKKEKKELLVFKVDFAKAYDSVDWGFLFDMMRRMNFPDRWVRWMRGCVTMARANVLVNGCPSGEFALERGIWQGDPLSPFLFLFVAEGLNILMKKAVSEGLLRPAVIGRDKVEVPISSMLMTRFFWWRVAGIMQWP